MEIKDYKNLYKQECLDIYAGNIGEYWRKDDLPDFDDFINEDSSALCKSCAFLGGEVVGFIGFRAIEDFIWIEWVVVHKPQHGMGVGKGLVEMAIKRVGSVAVRLSTTRSTLEFYRKCGFEIERIEKNGYPDGEDKIRMKYSIR